MFCVDWFCGPICKHCLIVICHFIIIVYLIVIHYIHMCSRVVYHSIICVLCFLHQASDNSVKDLPLLLNWFITFKSCIDIKVCSILRLCVVSVSRNAGVLHFSIICSVQSSVFRDMNSCSRVGLSLLCSSLSDFGKDGSQLTAVAFTRGHITGE